MPQCRTADFNSHEGWIRTARWRGRRVIPERGLGPETVRYLAAALGKLCHDLLLQPDIHRRRTIESAGVAEFLRQLLAGAKATVQFEQLHQIDDRVFPIKIFALVGSKFREDCFDVSSRDRLARR